MEVLTKRYKHDHVSSYKNRGEKLGASNRFVRAHRANKDRKAVRGDELSKRRGLDDTLDVKKPRNKQNDVAKPQLVVKGDVIEKENQPTEQITDQRKAMLMKWREQRELKKKAEAATKGQKSVFAVRHIQYDDSNSTAAPLSIKPIKKTAPKPKQNIPEKRVTRSSARLANKQPAKPAATKVKSGVKDIKSKKTSREDEEQSLKRVTRQSTKTASTSVVKTGPKSSRKKQEADQPKKDSSSECPKDKPSQDCPTNPPVQREEEIKSFAPANYQFTAPTGLYTFEYYSKEFKFEPLSPRSTSNFFQGITAFPSPKRDVITNQNFVPMSATSIGGTDPTEMSVNSEDKSQAGNVDDKGNDTVDSKYFRNLVSSETTRLNELCDKWENVLESTQEELTEEVKGNIRTAVGQAQLLISQRFKQFSGLIDLSEDESAEKKATMSDLQGFWDMIYFQVEDVNNKMDVLEKQKENGWVVEEKTAKKKKAKKILPKKIEGPKGAKAGGKSRIQELRAAMKAKMAEKKKLLSQNNEECSFITVLTPVKKNKNSGSHGDIILTPVRRSLRNTPIHQSTSRATPKVISTPKASSTSSPGLRLTPEVVSSATKDVSIEDIEMKEEKKPEEMRKDKSPETQVEIKMDQKTTEESHLLEDSSDGNVSERTSETTDEDMKDEKASLPSKRRSCLRSSTKRTRKSSRVFFQSPEPSAHSTAGGTPGAIVFTPGMQKNKLPTNVVFTPVAVSFDSPDEQGDTCSIDAGHTPALVLSGSRSLRSRKGTPCRKRHLGTPNGSMNTPVSKDEGSVAKRRSLRRRSGRQSSSEEETFLPDKYILPSTSSESDEEENSTSPSLKKPESSGCDQPLLSFTPLKDSSDLLNKSNLTPASRLQALCLDDSPDNRRDSVFFAPGGHQQEEKTERDNLICFSPLAE